jgi:hypothetical protein
MSLANVVLYAGLLVLMVYKRAQGRPIGTTKQLFLLPAIITVLGFEDLSHAKLGTIDIAVGVAGCGLSLLLGALRGTQDKLSRRDGTPWVQWGAVSVVIFAVNIVAKLALDVAGVALGGSTSGVTASLLLAVGLMLVGEAAVVWAPGSRPALCPVLTPTRRPLAFRGPARSGRAGPGTVRTSSGPDGPPGLGHRTRPATGDRRPATGDRELALAAGRPVPTACLLPIQSS